MFQSVSSHLRPAQIGRFRAAGLRIVLAVLGISQPGIAADPSQPMRFDSLSLDNGLSQNTILSIYQDQRGFLWFGTEDGLNRYDGYEIRIYRHDNGDPGSLPGDLVYAIEEDEGGLWVATQGGGLGRWLPELDRFEPAPMALTSSSLRTLHRDARGRLWVGTLDAGVYVWDEERGRIEQYRRDPTDPNSLSHDSVYAITSDNRGRVWLGTDGGLDVLDDGDSELRHVHLGPREPQSTEEDARIRALELDSEGTLWIGTIRSGLYALDPETSDIAHFHHDPDEPRSLSSDRISAVLQDAQGRLWIGTASGLDLLDSDRRSFVRYEQRAGADSSLKDDFIMSLHQDRSGVLWVGTRSAGAAKWNPSTWLFGHHAPPPSGHTQLSDAMVSSFAEDGTGRLWIGTFGSGIDVLDRSTGAVSHFRSGGSERLSDDRVMVMKRTRDGAIWVGTMDGGLNRYDETSGRFRVYRHDPDNPETLGAHGIMSLFQTADGALWVGTFGGGSSRFDPTRNRFERLAFEGVDPAALTQARVTAFAEDRGGGLSGFGTESGGLHRLELATGQLRSYRHDPGSDESVPSDTIYSLYVSESDELWVGTRSGGLARLRAASGSARPRFETFTTADGLTSEVVYGILPGNAGELWLSTNRGLARFAPDKETFRLYRAQHGLQSDEFNFGSRFRSESGELFVGGINGFNAFFPERLRDNPFVPPVVLTSFQKFNRDVPEVLSTVEFGIDEIHLSHTDDVVTLEFAALDYRAPEHNRYAYRLEGFDGDWVDSKNRRRVTYTNLDPGRYVFRVRAASADGQWNEEGLAIPIDVDYPPWRRWWAYVLYVLAAAGILLGAFRLHRSKIAREEAYARTLEHEVEQRTGELADRNSQLEQLNTKLQESNFTDALTGLRNRRFLFEHIYSQPMSSRHGRSGRDPSRGGVESRLSLMMLDLDRFKRVNDSHGHQAGDELLVQVGKLLADTCRETDVAIRWGGDEFVLIAPDCDAQQAQRLAERIRKTIVQHVFRIDGDEPAQVGCSIGFASVTMDPSESRSIPWDELLGLADFALYAVKRSTRNAWLGLVLGEPTSPAEVLAKLRTSDERSEPPELVDVVTSIEREGRPDLLFGADTSRPLRPAFG